MKSSASFGIRHLVIYDFTSVHSSDILAAISIVIQFVLEGVASLRFQPWLSLTIYRREISIIQETNKAHGARSEGRLWGQVSAYEVKSRLCPQTCFLSSAILAHAYSRIFASVS